MQNSAPHLQEIDCTIFLSICNALGALPNYLAAETLTHNELDCCIVLLKLWKKATPEQIEVIAAIIKAAVENQSKSFAILGDE